MDGPHELFMAQIQHESRCDAGVTAFDGGAGLGQFMAGTAKWIHSREPALQEISELADPYDPRWAIRALILYDDYLYKLMRPCEGWYYALRAYNGGAGNLKKEIKRAGSCDRGRVEAECRRKVITLKSRKLDMCRDVNIPYYYRIEKEAENYR
jgi:soluble lytic murein transglycosylase-like protein